MKISVVTVCYNVADCIEQTMLSVLNQSYPDIEYIVIDGGSTDGTVDIIKKYADRLAYWVSEPDKGIYDAMNKGIAAASGSYINFMNAGDTFASENTVARVVESINEGSDVIYGGSITHSKNGKEKAACPNPFFRQQKWLKHPGINHQSTFIKNSLLKKYGFDCRYRIAADFNLLDIIYRNKGVFQELDYPVARYDMSGISSVSHSCRIREFAAISGYSPHSFRVRLHIAVFYIKQFIRNIYGS